MNITKRLTRSDLRTRLVATCLTALGGVSVAHGTAPTTAPKPAGSPWPEGPRNTLIRPAVEAYVDALLGKMTLEEKIGQMIQADIESVRPDDLKEYKLGSILAGGNAAPGGNVRAPARDWLALTTAFARAAEAGGTAAHAPIPLLFGVDAVHGHARIPGATIFPHNVGLGAAHDPELITRIGRVTAAEVASTGIDWTFAPTVAVVRDVRWGRSYESYSEDPALVASYAAAMVTGLQGAIGTPDFMAAGHTVSSVKHFMGDGGTLRGRDQFDNRAPVAEFARVHAAGCPPAIAAGVLTVMASYNSSHGTKMHASRELLTGVLKERFGFNGFVVGDWNAQEEIPGCTKFDCPAAIRAGLDMFMAPDSWKDLYRNTLRHARSGAIPETRINDAVRRILRVKALAGLFERKPADRAAAEAAAVLGSAAHRSVAREAVRKSLVLLKNEGGLLPLKPAQHVLVAGAAADDIGQAAGGWTIDWQGSHNTNADFPGATSIYAGLRQAIDAGGGTTELSRTGSYTAKPSVAIVVFGETPYAEFQGDRETLEYSPADKSDLALIRKLRGKGIPVVALFLSGRPLWVNREINAANAFVAAWLPGSEGGGVADVLIRRTDNAVNFDFSGTLAFSWPATTAPASFVANDLVHGAQFERGYGLNYARPAAVKTLPETPSAIAPDRSRPSLLFGGGRVTAPWSIFVQDSVAEVRLTTPSQASPTGAAEIALDATALRAHWSNAAVLRIAGRPVDLRKEAADGEALTIRLRVQDPPAGQVMAGIRCSKPFGAEVPSADLPNEAWLNCKAAAPPVYDVTAELAKAKRGSIVTLTLPLHCFAERGADLSAVEAPFAIATRAALRIVITEVRLERPAQPASCPTPP